MAEIEVADNGKLIAEMAAQNAYVPQWYQYFGGLADKIEGAVIAGQSPLVNALCAAATARSASCALPRGNNAHGLPV
jgi:hypothetical protein